VLVNAAGGGNIQVVQALLAAGADPSQRGELSRFAARRGGALRLRGVAELLRAAFHELLRAAFQSKA
jgi:hypothetical protein